MGNNNETTGLGEFWDKWVEESEEEKQQFEEMKRKAHNDFINNCYEEAMLENSKRDELQKRYNFLVTENILPALERLEGLAVNKFRMLDYSEQDSFDAVWRSVLHEVNLFEEGEESSLNKNSCRGAKNWLKSFSHLCKTGVPEEYHPREKAYDNSRESKDV